MSGYNDRNTTNTPIIDKTNQKNDFNINNCNWQITHFSKSSNERQRESKDIHFETSNKFAPLLMENTDDVTKSSSTKIASATSKKSHPIKLISHFERKKRADTCATENYIKNFTPVTIPDNSNYASISENGRKILVVGDSHVKRIRIDFNKELRNGKAYFRSFSSATSKQLDHYIIPSLVDDHPDAVIIHVGTNDISYNANYEDIARNIIKIGSSCKSHGVNNVFVSSILVKKIQR